MHYAAVNGQVEVMSFFFFWRWVVVYTERKKESSRDSLILCLLRQAVKLLLAAGASPAVLNSFERTPFDDAQSRNNAGVLQAIAEHCQEDPNTLLESTTSSNSN